MASGDALVLGVATLFACTDAFVVKLRPNGSVEWATLLGGMWNDLGRAIAVDPVGTVWVAGETMSEDFPASPNAVQRAFRGRVELGPLEYGDAFLARLDSSGRRLVYATCLGGSSVDYATAVVALNDGVVVTGATQSADFPVAPNAHQAAFSGGMQFLPNSSLDAFIAHFSLSGERRYATYAGQANVSDYASGAALDSTGKVGISTRRPLTAAGSIISIYGQGVGGGADTSVRLGQRMLTVLYAGGDQVNAVVPADMPLGVHALTVRERFFSTIPGRAPGTVDGIFQVNARVPMNAQTGRVGLRVTFRTEHGILQTPVAWIWVR